jgi:CYTH domain-containing protein
MKMGREIERKFLVIDDSWKTDTLGEFCRQGYLSLKKERLVRVRTLGEKGYLTVKGLSHGISRPEYEYEIPLKDAHEMLDQLCERPLVEKNRYRLAFKGMTWEIDEFVGENDGLVVAEIELDSEDQAIALPHWVGTEVSLDPKYYNFNLVRHPYKDWR